jgi:hypothetical protein
MEERCTRVGSFSRGKTLIALRHVKKAPTCEKKVATFKCVAALTPSCMCSKKSRAKFFLALSKKLISRGEREKKQLEYYWAIFSAGQKIRNLTVYQLL